MEADQLVSISISQRQFSMILSLEIRPRPTRIVCTLVIFQFSSNIQTTLIFSDLGRP
jgi:hypothetical protein